MAVENRKYCVVPVRQPQYWPIVHAVKEMFKLYCRLALVTLQSIIQWNNQHDLTP